MDEMDNKMAESVAGAADRWNQVHVAAGLAVYNPQIDHSVMDTVRRADKVMYINKRKRKEAAE